MFSPAFSALWLMVGYLVLLILLGVFTVRFGRMKGIHSKAGYLGAIFWLIGVAIFFILAQVGSPDALILMAVSIVAPLLYIINLIPILLEKKHTWVEPEYKRKGRRYLMIYISVLAIYVIGLIIA
ncbi:MAG: hypothetical protein K0B06_01205 [Brevefilum sp.]|nr:hypothetical protein [Brevefilum sp.]